MQNGRFAEAEHIYREDLKDFGKSWSLYACLKV